MRRSVFGLVLFALCGSAVGQPPPPGLPTARIQSVFPPGAKAGPVPVVRQLGMTFPLDTVITVTGTDLEEPEALLFSHPGIKGEYLAPLQPRPDPKKKETPKASPGPHSFRVTVDPKVPAGTYDVRFVGKWGVSNPRAFVINHGIELNEKEPNNDVPEAQRLEIGATVNGIIVSATDVDYSIFAARKGQRVIVSCVTSSIDGRASPQLEIYDSSGRKLALGRGYRDNDALADVIIPADGDYIVRLSQFAYQGGGPDFLYRLSITTAPWIDAVFPPAIEPGKPAQVTLYGRNLPNSQPADGFTVNGRPLEKLSVTVTPPSDAAAATRLAVFDRIDPTVALQDGFEYVLAGPSGSSNPVPIYFARERVVVSNNAGGSSAANPRAITPPCEAAGFLAQRSELDWYAFNAKKGEQCLVEVLGERHGTGADFYFSIRDGKDPKRDLSGELDDDNDSLHPFGFFTRTTDPPAYRFTAPEDGKYLVVVGCRESGVLSGPRTAYRLRIAAARPDFRAVAMPYSRHYQTGSTAWQGGTHAYDIFLHRMDGYTGAVSVVAAGLPTGVKARPLTIGPGARWGILVLDIASTAAPFTGPITLNATGTTTDGKTLTREVRPASITWGVNIQQNQAPVIARLDRALLLAIRPVPAFFTLAPDPARATRKVNGKDEKLDATLTVKQGDKFSVPVKVNWIHADKQPVVLTFEPLAVSTQSSPFTVQFPAQPTKDKPEALANIDVKTNALPGTYSIAVKGVAQVPFLKDPSAKGKGPNVPAEVIGDPIQVTVIPTSLAKVTAALPKGSVKLGETGAIVVKVERLYDYSGEFKVKLELPMGTKGISANDVTIPAGQDEAKLVFKVAADAKPGAVSNAVVTVTGIHDKKHAIGHEAKVTFTVAK